MKETRHNKLVRDKIIDIIVAAGKTPRYRVLDESEMESQLKSKLQEEILEFIESGSIEELADIFEVILSIVEYRGQTMADLLAISQQKAAKNGRFKERLFLESVEEE